MAAGWLLAASAAAGSSALTPAGPVSWVQSSYDDFKAGEIDSLMLDGDGELRLAPEMRLLGDTGEAYVWSVDEGADGIVYASAGADGKIYRIDPSLPDAAPTVLFEADGTVHALAVGPDDHLYVAVSSSGAIWRLPLGPDEETPSEPWFSTGARYTWDLVFAPDGTLYAGTGEDGVIHRVRTDGTGDVLYDSSETHITSLAVDGEGNVLAGSADNGHVYRIGDDGDVFVAFDSPMRQITAIVPTAEGAYVAGLEQAAGGVAPGPESQVAATGSTAATAGGAGASLSGAVFLIRADGFAERLWESRTETPHSMAAAEPGVIVGTGPRGRLLRVRPGPRIVILQDADAAQVTALKGRGATLIAGTSNLGRVYALTESFRRQGAYVSQVRDTATTSRWGRVRWRGLDPPGTSIRLFSRTGNTADPDDTWSAWSGPYSDATGSVLDSPAARFIQWKAELATTDPSASPVLQWVEVVYVPRNLRPEIDAFTVHPAGVVYRQTASFEDSLPIGQIPEVVQQSLARLQGRQGPQAGAPAGGFLGRPFFVPGSQTFSWQVSDPNGDRITYSVAYRGEGEETWKPMVSDLSEKVHTWDTTAVPDGLYRARLSASDAPANPSGQALSETRSSQPFIVDNTAPVISSLAGADEGGTFRVTGGVADATSLIRSIEYAIDGGSWHAVLPADGLADSGAERIEFTTATLAAGEHTIVVKATDTALNSGTAKVVLSTR